MTDIETKALAVANEVRHEAGYPPVVIITKCLSDKILVRAIEQNEAFKQEVSDAVSGYMAEDYRRKGGKRVESLLQFIIAKPDPLVEAFIEVWPTYTRLSGVVESHTEALRAALAARGLKIVEADK